LGFWEPVAEVRLQIAEVERGWEMGRLAVVRRAIAEVRLRIAEGEGGWEMGRLAVVRGAIAEVRLQIAEVERGWERGRLAVVRRAIAEVRLQIAEGKADCRFGQGVSGGRGNVDLSAELWGSALWQGLVRGQKGRLQKSDCRLQK
jgi:hypothetical protein